MPAERRSGSTVSTGTGTSGTSRRNLKAVGGSEFAGQSRISKKAEPAACHICGKVVSRISDIHRHMKTHDPCAEKLPCPWEGCKFRTLQKSNLETHIRRHTQDKIHVCYDDPPNCDFRSCDQASLNRHRKEQHNHMSGRRKKSSQSTPAPLPPKPSSSTLPPLFRETPSSLPPMPTSLHYQGLFPNGPLPWDGIGFSAESQMNGSHDRLEAADPASHPLFGYQHDNYAAEYQDSQPSFSSTYGSMSAPTLPTYYYSPMAFPTPSPIFNYSADQSGFYHPDASGDYFDQHRWAFGTD